MRKSIKKSAVVSSAKKANENIANNPTYRGVETRRKSFMSTSKNNPIVHKFAYKLSAERGIGKMLSYIKHNPGTTAAEVRDALGYKSNNTMNWQTMNWAGLISSRNPGYKITRLGSKLLKQNNIM